MSKAFLLVRRARPFLALALASSLTACGWFSSDKDEKFTDQPVEILYNRALDDLGRQEYKTAAKEFEEVDRQHPYSVWATKAQIMAAFTYYQSNKYDDAIIALDRFIQLHPGHRDVAYAYYLKALDYYIQITDVERDQKVTQQAYDALAEVVRRFPDTRYARDAKFKMDLCRDHLAGKEMQIGRWYEGQGQYLAAINRFQTVVNNYQTTTHIPEALERLVECYYALGLSDEAKRTAAVLGYNYPQSKWYVATYALVTTGSETAKEERGWLARVVDPFGLF